MFVLPVPCCGCSRLAGILMLLFWIWSISDCLKNEPAGSNDKILWGLLVVCVPFFGGVYYYFVRRPERIARYGR